MSKKPVTTARKTDVATYRIPTRAKAWEFMRLCEAAGMLCGFPSLSSDTVLEPSARTVQVGIRTDEDRIKADALAEGAPVVDYYFKGSEVAITS